MGKTSLTLSHSFYKKNHEENERILAAKARVTIVALDERANQKTELPAQLTDSLRRLHVKIGVARVLETHTRVWLAPLVAN